ncbi:ABC transporter permease [Bacteroidota bacterium]
MILTLLAISFATFLSIGMRGIQLGTYAVNIKNAVNMFSGYLQLQHKDYQKNPSLKYNFKFDNTLEEQINSIDKVKGYSERVYGDGLISFKDNSQGAAIFGIDPQKENQVTNIMDRIMEGRFFSSDTSKEIVVGHKLLENLKAQIGDEVVVLSQGYDGSLGNLKFKITGTFKSGSSDLDGMGAFIGLRTAQELLALDDKVNVVVLTLNNLNDIEEVKNDLQSKISNKDVVVLSWEEVMPDFKQSIDLDNISGILFLLILIVIVAFGILNTVLMSVTERFNEFGISLSIGMPQIKLVYLVFIETIFIAVIGIVLGNIIGWAINNYILLNPIQFGGEFEKIYAEYGFLPVIESSLNITIFINTSVSIFVISLISSFYPAFKVYKLEPLKGIRYT